MTKPLYDRGKDSESLGRLEETIGKFELRKLVSSAGPSTDLFTKECPRYTNQNGGTIYTSIQLCEICRYNHGFVRGIFSVHPDESICTKLNGSGRKIKLSNW